MKTKIILFSSCILLLFIQSCTITKRHYLPGYSVEWQKNKISDRAVDLITEDSNAELVNSLVYAKPNDEMPISASIDISESYSCSQKTVLKLNREKKYFTIKSIEGCDNIAFKNGEEINAKILEISKTEIKYKKCNNLDGPTFIIPKSDASKIKFSNGTTEVINSVKPKAEDSDYYDPPSKPTPSHYSSASIINKFALASMILAVVSIFFFPLVPLPIIFGIIALKQIQRAPEAQRGRGMAIFGIVLGGLIALAVLAFLLILISLLLI
ncbi:MAG: DUF4190 domain-containing protein [Bacteroidetes bacterium]|nr:DUF4190 domain-containing protein [Bacteroidota bacterium]